MKQSKEELQKNDLQENNFPEDDFLQDDFLKDRNICSSTDCTGLIPSLPVSDSEITSYEQLYHFLPKAKG